MEKTQKDVSDKIDKLLKTENKIDTLIKQGEIFLELSEK
jgi:hypothetical protein